MNLNLYDLGENTKSHAQQFMISTQNNINYLTGVNDIALTTLPLNDIKGKLREELRGILIAKPNARVYVDYFTNGGWVTNGAITNTMRDKNAINEKTINEKIGELMTDPKKSKERPSGEANNNLTDKEIWGVRINVF